MAGRAGGWRVVGVDRIWGVAEIVTLAAPVDVPSRTDLVAAVRELGNFAATTRIGWLLDVDAGRWRFTDDLDAFAEACVQVVDPPVRPAAAAALVQLRERGRGGLPLSVIAWGDAIGLNVTHPLGDGHYVNRLLPAIVETARTGSVPEWVRQAPTRHPVAKGLWGHFVRQPRNALDLGRYLVTRSGARSPGPTTPTVAAVPPGSPYRPSPASRVQFMAPSVFVDFRRWRKQFMPELSTIPVTIAAVDLAVRQAGITPSTDPLVLFDARRYVRPGGSDVDGNFSAGLRLRVRDSSDAYALDAQMKAAVAMGRPLAVMASASTRRWARIAPEVPAKVAVGNGWDVVYTHMGRGGEISRLPRRDAEHPAEYVAYLTPAGPHAVTFALFELGNRLMACASFDDGVVDADTVERVLSSVCSDPVALLDGWRVRGDTPAPQPAALSAAS